MDRFSLFAFRVSMLLLIGALLAAPALAQQATDPAINSPAPKSAPTAEAPKPAASAVPQSGMPVSMTMPEFLAKYDKFLALGEARAAAEKKRAEYEAAVKVLGEQLNELAAELRAQIPKDHVWDPAKREFIKPAIPEKAKEKP